MIDTVQLAVRSVHPVASLALVDRGCRETDEPVCVGRLFTADWIEEQPQHQRLRRSLSLILSVCFVVKRP